MPLHFIQFSVMGYVLLMRIHEFYLYCQKTTQSTGNKQLTRQFYRQLSSLPSNKAARGQSRLGSICSSTENLQSSLG